MMTRTTILLLLCFAISTLQAAQPPELKAEDLPRVKPTEAVDALKTFQIKKGFKLQLVAAEPLVIDPIALSFDGDGRMFVVEMIDYSERRDEHLSRIRMLEDTDGDGVYDQSRIFLDNLSWATAVTCYDGGIFVGAAPDLIWAKDTNGDGVADERKVVFSGFGNTQERLNVQGLFNNFSWGLDNRIHVCSGHDGGNVVPVGPPSTQVFDVRNKGLVFDPRSMRTTLENGGGQYGLSADPFGQWFTCSNSRHIMTFMFPSRYADQNPLYTMPDPLVDIPADGPAAEVYRISPEEPWRVIRTKWRVAGLASGPIEGGGRSAGYFTGATGVTIYRGDAMKDLIGDAFIGDAGGNLVHHKKIRRDGVSFVAERPSDEQKVEFLASSDNWFRPVDFANAPDGSLYVIDMYRETIEHPWSLPPGIKKFLDLNSGNDRGRIYRVVPENFVQRPQPKMSKATTDELVALLEHPNGWHRETASRLLYTRQDQSAVKKLVTLLTFSKSPVARLHALYALQGLKALDRFLVVKGLQDSNARVRENAIRLAETMIKASSDATLLYTRLELLADDPDISVRYQLALTLGQIEHPERMNMLLLLAKKDLRDKWMQVAILSALRDGAAQMFDELATDPASRTTSGVEFLGKLAGLIGAAHDQKQVEKIVKRIDGSSEPATKLSLARALASGLRRADKTILDAGPSVQNIMTQAKEIAVDGKMPEPVRIDAIALLGFNTFEQSGKTLTSLLNPSQPQSSQLAAIASLETFNEPKVSDEILSHWPSMSPRVRSDAIAMLLKRPQRVTALLKAIEANVIRPSDLDAGQVRFLQTHADATIQASAKKLLSPAPSTQRAEVIEAFMPALKLQGDASHGKTIYRERCISCHRIGDDGFALGPDLVTVRNTGREKMLINIIEPNRELAANYTAYLVESKDGESVVGLITSESPTSVTVKQAYGRETTIARDKLKRIKSQGRSLMPEGLEAGLKSQDFADLLEFLSTVGAK